MRCSLGSIAFRFSLPSRSACSTSSPASTPSFTTSTTFSGSRGFSKVSGDLQAVAIGGTNLLFTMIAMSVIDNIGRKTLLLVGSVGTALCLAGVAYIFFTQQHQSLLVWLLVGFIAFFAFSQGAVIWVYIGEVFPNQVRAKGQSLGQLFALVHERRHLSDLSVGRALLRRVPVRVLLGDDGGAIVRGRRLLPRNQRRFPRRDATEARNRVTP